MIATHFDEKDVVRHKLVQDINQNYTKYEHERSCW